MLIDDDLDTKQLFCHRDPKELHKNIDATGSVDQLDYLEQVLNTCQADADADADAADSDADADVDDAD